MRILHVFKTFPPDTHGGIEYIAHQIAQGGGKHGIESRIVTLSSQGERMETDASGYEVHRYRRDLNIASTGMSLSFLRHFRRESEWADLLHFHFPWPFGDLAYLLSGSRVPALMTYHSDIIKQERLLALYRPLRDRHLARMRRIVATSPNYLASSEALQRWRGKTVVIPCGIPEVPARDPAAIARVRQHLGERFFAFVGVPRYYKGLDFLLDALAGRDYPLALVGDGEERDALEARAKELGLRNVHFLGALDDEAKADVLAAATAFVFPSHVRTEAFGLALAEAAQQGLPMISCEIGTGTTFVNLHEQTGLAVPPCDSAALRAAMDRMWNEPEQAREWGRRAYRRYREQLTQDAMVAAYAGCYRELLAAAADEGLH